MPVGPVVLASLECVNSCKLGTDRVPILATVFSVHVLSPCVVLGAREPLSIFTVICPYTQLLLAIQLVL